MTVAIMRTFMTNSASQTQANVSLAVDRAIQALSSLDWGPCSS